MEYRKLSINEIQLDLENPRIKQYIEMYGDSLTEDSIALALTSTGDGKSSSYSALKESIRVNRGIINPIIVNKRADGSLVVIEGNTRLQIYKEFVKAEPDGPWNEILAIVYDNVDDYYIHSIRLQIHLVGPRDWDPFSKAKYLDELYHKEKLPMEKIISLCGGKSAEIHKLIDAYQDMTKYYIPKAEEVGLDPNPQEFSKFAELQNRSIINALVVHGFEKSNFAEWVINGNVDNAQNVRKLPAILANPKAKSVFLKRNINEAVRVLHIDHEGGTDLSGASIYELALELINRIIMLPIDEARSLANDSKYEEKVNNLQELHEELITLFEDLESLRK